ncbi:Flp family type IVb pilin [Sphingopyxis sp. R3-92]|uniref:Flp family type IVb pilin n=1 Tax=Sphingopyxis sp. R3-92 TaxID=3158553 RepID=UPI003EE4E9BC
MKFFKKFVRNNKAATAIEYGLIAALIAVGLISTLGLVGGEVNNTFKKVETGLKATPAPAP